MKILIATPLYPPDSGGPATYAKLLEEHLPGLGDEIVLVKFGDVRNLPKIIRHIAYFSNVLKAAKKEKVDLILALDPVSSGLPALFAARFVRKPFAVKIVGDFAWEQSTQRFGIIGTLDEFVQRSRVPAPVACLRAVQVFVAKNASQIIVPSEYLKRIITSRAWGSIPPEKISVIYNSIQLPIELEKEIRSSNESGKESLHFSLEIISAGRLVPWKGMDGVIDAVAEIRKKIPSVSLTIIGDGPEKRNIEAKAHAQFGSGADIESAGAVTFTGQLSNFDALRRIKAADIFVLNSTYEGLSHLLIEALMLGKAIVATTVGGNPELIEDGVNGLLVASGDAAALAAALEKLLTDGELRARLGAHAQDSSSRFALSIMIQKTHDLLSSLAAH